LSPNQCDSKKASMIDALVLKKIEQIINYCLSNHLAFFTYRVPDSDRIKIGVQKDLNLMNYHEFAELEGKQGFVFAPFESSERHPSWFIRDDFSFSSDTLTDSEVETLGRYQNSVLDSEDVCPAQSLEEDYFSQISEILRALKGNELEKAILSRIQTEKGGAKAQRANLFIQLCQHYPQAFVSYVSLPGICSWMGASPELLFKSHKGRTETVALAGTLPAGNSDLADMNWGKKEIEEQAFVSDYIERVFRKNAIAGFERKGPYTVQAGQVVHLKTEFKTQAELSFCDKAGMISALHPTPAVCGLPKQEAFDLIKKVEKHDREYYAGFWGPIGAKGSCELYVNLRTMKISENHLSLFVGGGITIESIPKKEWEETQYKAQTLLSVIKAGKYS